MVADVLSELRLILSSIDGVYESVEHFSKGPSYEKIVSYIEQTGDTSILALIGRSDSRRLHSLASFILDEIKVSKSVFEFLRSSYFAGHGLSIQSYFGAFPSYLSKPDGDLTILVRSLLGSDPITRAYAIDALQQCLALNTVEAAEIRIEANIVIEQNPAIAGLFSNLDNALLVAATWNSNRDGNDNLDTFVGLDAMTLITLEGLHRRRASR